MTLSSQEKSVSGPSHDVKAIIFNFSCTSSSQMMPLQMSTRPENYLKIFCLKTEVGFYWASLEGVGRGDTRSRMHYCCHCQCIHAEKNFLNFGSFAPICFFFFFALFLRGSGREVGWGNALFCLDLSVFLCDAAYCNGDKHMTDRRRVY